MNRPFLAAGRAAATITRPGEPTSTVKERTSSAARSSLPSSTTRPCRMPGSRPPTSNAVVSGRSADGETLFFTSDQSGNESIWQATVTAVRDDVKKSFELATKPAGEAVKPAANQVETQNEKPADKQKDDDEPEDEVGAADTTGSEEQKSASKKVD